MVTRRQRRRKGFEGNYSTIFRERTVENPVDITGVVAESAGYLQITTQKFYCQTILFVLEILLELCSLIFVVVTQLKLMKQSLNLLLFLKAPSRTVRSMAALM